VSFSLRDATVEDLPAVDAIYNHYVTTSTCTYQYEPNPLGARQAWFAGHGPSHPVIVAVDGDEIIGWGSLSSFREREGYRFTVEDTVYVDHRHHRRGVGRAIVVELIARARRLGHRTIIAGVSAEQTGSVALHQALGFVEVARFREVGFKFDTWLDVIFLQLML
jgi:phosphinothricin acetyltransferase